MLLPQIVAAGSTLIAESEDAMSWRIGDHGFQMTLSARLPELIARNLRGWLDGWLNASRADCRRRWARGPYTRAARVSWRPSAKHSDSIAGRSIFLTQSWRNTATCRRRLFFSSSSGCERPRPRARGLPWGSDRASRSKRLLLA